MLAVVFFSVVPLLCSLLLKFVLVLLAVFLVSILVLYLLVVLLQILPAVLVSHSLIQYSLPLLLVLSAVYYLLYL